VLIRAERADEAAAVRAVNLAAFMTPFEANLVDALRVQAAPLVSLVAESDGAIVGHILFSPVTLAARDDLAVMGLAPMAVLPERQRAGVGSALVRAGLDRCRALACPAVVVLGHPAFYPRFGFVPASRFGIRCEYDVADEVFMAMELDPGALNFARGLVRYHPAFGMADLASAERPRQEPG
jgi:putative acetyltransferase